MTSNKYIKFAVLIGCRGNDLCTFHVASIPAGIRFLIHLFLAAKMGIVLRSFFCERVSTDWLRFAVISNSLCVL